MLLFCCEQSGAAVSAGSQDPQAHRKGPCVADGTWMPQALRSAWTARCQARAFRDQLPKRGILPPSAGLPATCWQLASRKQNTSFSYLPLLGHSLSRITHTVLSEMLMPGLSSWVTRHCLLQDRVLADEQVQGDKHFPCGALREGCPAELQSGQNVAVTNAVTLQTLVLSETFLSSGAFPTGVGVLAWSQPSKFCWVLCCIL